MWFGLISKVNDGNYFTLENLKTLSRHCISVYYNMPHANLSSLNYMSQKYTV